VIRLAIVEDIDFTRELTVERLQARFGAVASVEPFESVEQLVDSAARFDLVVLDLSLDGQAIQHYPAVRLVAAMTKVVVFSDYRSKEAVDQARNAGALGYVSKNSAHAADSLAVAIRKALEGERFLDPDTAAKIEADQRRRMLNPRMCDVLRLEALGRTTRQIAREVGLSESGVRKNVDAIKGIYPEGDKQTERARLAVRLGLVGESEPYQPPDRRRSEPGAPHG